MSSTTAELEAKLRQRMQKCEGSSAVPPKPGQRVWSDEMAKTVSQQRRARVSGSAKSQGDNRGGNPQDVEGIDALHRNISSTSSKASRRGLRAKEGGAKAAQSDGGAETTRRRTLLWLPAILVLAFAGLLYLRLGGEARWGGAEDGPNGPTTAGDAEPDRPSPRTPEEPEQQETSGSAAGSELAESFEGRPAADEGDTSHNRSQGELPPNSGDEAAEGAAAELASNQSVVTSRADLPELPQSIESTESADTEAIGTFRAMVKEVNLASHSAAVTVEGRTSGDVSSEWQSFLEAHPAIQQVFQMGRVTVAKFVPRTATITVNITLFNTGSAAWQSAALQAVHGSDLGVESVQLSGVVDPGADCKISLRLRLPQFSEGDLLSSMWALNMNGHVFGPLLLLEMDWNKEEDDASVSLPGMKPDSSAQVQAVKLELLDKALREDPAKVGDVSQDWAADLANIGIAQAYQLGSVTVRQSLPSRLASMKLLVKLQNTGSSTWPKGTGLQLVSGKSFGCEFLPIHEEVRPGLSLNVLMKLEVPTQEDEAQTVRESVWALGHGEQFFGPLLILEMSHVA